VLPKLELVLQLAVPELQELHQVNGQLVVFELARQVPELQVVCRRYLEELQALVLGEFHPLEN
jgi:hypothetical protein